MLTLLLQTLAEGLEPRLAGLLEDPALRLEAEKYLLDLLLNDDLLSTDSYKTSASETGPRTLTEEIAELDNAHRHTNMQLAAVANENRDLIVDVSSNIASIHSQIGLGLSNELQLVQRALDSVPSRFQVQLSEKLDGSIAVNNAVLANIDPVLDLLELPTLCKLCIVQGNYQELLEVSLLAQTLVIRFPKLTTFQRIHWQVQQELGLMVRGLIKLLNTNLKQNNILKIFQILNKPDLVGHTSGPRKDRFLKMVFLNARFKFITNEIANLAPLIKFNRLTYLKRFIEVYREYIFNSLSVYFAIFGSSHDDSPDSACDDTILISQFVKNLVALLSDALYEHFPLLISKDTQTDDLDSNAQKDGVILQIIYLCKSLVKYNVDFEAIITWELCYRPNPLISEDDWLRNLAKVKKFRS